MGDAIAEWFRWLAVEHRINVSIMWDAYDRDQFLRGLTNTIDLSLKCVGFSLVVGAVCAWLQGSRIAPVRWAVQTYVEVFRNTPPLVQLLFFYFALGPLTPQVATDWGGTQPMIGNAGWAVIAISLFAGAHNTEIFRSGVEAVPPTMVEAAESLGYGRTRTYTTIVLPLALRICLPALNSNTINTIKTTTLAYAISVPELLYASAQIWSETLNVREMMNVLLFSFLGLIALGVWVMNWFERRLRIPGYSV